MLDVQYSPDLQMDLEPPHTKRKPGEVARSFPACVEGELMGGGPCECKLSLVLIASQNAVSYTS